MNLYACGYNESANLKEPPSCPRYHIRRPSPCIHNDSGKDPNGLPYCPLMILSLTPIIQNATAIRVIYADHNSTFLDVNGELRILGLQYPEIGESEIGSRAKEIRLIFGLNGMMLLGMHLDDGSILILQFRKDGGKMFTRHSAKEERKILHIAFGDSGSVSIIPRSNPRTVLLFSSATKMLAWLGESSEKEIEPSKSFTLPEAVTQLVGNLNGFTALVYGGEVFNWTGKTTTQHHSTVITKDTSTQSSPATILNSKAATTQEEEEEEESDPGPDMSALLDDPSISTPLPTDPQTPEPNFSKMNLPPTTTLAATAELNAAISTSQTLHLWSTPFPPSADTPTIHDLGPRSHPHLAQIPSAETTTPITSIALGRNHIIALCASSGSLFSVGDGKSGQLGIGTAIFDTHAQSQDFNPHADEPREFAEDWQSMGVRALALAEGEKVTGVFCGEGTTFVTTTTRRT